jgi:LAO/AO transport system kinase
MDVRALARAVTAIENGAPVAEAAGGGRIVGITGPPGAGKSTLVDALAGEIRQRGKTVAILAVDPSSRSTGGAILGDRVRMMRHHGDAGVFIRSMATRGAVGGLARTSREVARFLRGRGFDYILIETVGVGQDEIEIATLADVTVLVLMPGAGDDVQAIKAGVMEIAGIYVINKADHAGIDRTEHDIRGNGRMAPVLRTVATTGSGVAEVLAAIDAAPAGNRTANDEVGVAVQSVVDALRRFESALGIAPGTFAVEYPATGEVPIRIIRKES